MKNFEYLQNNWYIVRTQAGLRKAIKHYDSDFKGKRNIHNPPKKYPAFVTINTYESICNQTHAVIKFMHVNKLKDILKNQ